MASWLETKVKIDWAKVQACSNVVEALQEYHTQLIGQLGTQRDFDHRMDGELFKIINEYIEKKNRGT